MVGVFTLVVFVILSLYYVSIAIASPVQFDKIHIITFVINDTLYSHHVQINNPLLYVVLYPMELQQ